VPRRLRFVWAVLRGAVRKSREDGLTTLAQAIAYALFLAIPAAALVVLGVFSLVADPEAIDRVVDSAQGVMPTEAADLLRQSLERSARSTGSNVVLTVLGLALALWTTTSAAGTLMMGLTRAFEEEDSRGLARKRLISLLIVVALVACAALVATFLVLGPQLERWLGSTLDAEGVTAWVWWTAQWPFLVGFLLLGFAAVLYLGPGADQHSLRHVVPGAVVAVLAWLAVSGAFAYYTANFGSYNKSWGALSAVVVTLVWLWLTSAALLFGAEVNAEVRRREATRADELELRGRA
jgi:membrane protein